MNPDDKRVEGRGATGEEEGGEKELDVELVLWFIVRRLLKALRV